MRRSKEIVVLIALLLGAVAFVLWYVADRRERHSKTPTVTRSIGPLLTGEGVEGQSADGKTLNLSTGRPVMSETPEDKQAIEDAMKDIKSAADGALFTREEQEAAAKRAAEQAEQAEQSATPPPRR